MSNELKQTQNWENIKSLNSQSCYSFYNTSLLHKINGILDRIQTCLPWLVKINGHSYCGET